MELKGLLLLCALALTSGSETPSSATNNRHRRASGSSATELFLSIVGQRPNDKSNLKYPILPVQLPIKLGGHGGVTLPVLVVPVPIYTNNPDSCSANHQATTEEKPAAPTQAVPSVPIFQSRQQFSQVQTTPEPAPQPISHQQFENVQEAIQINEQLQDIQPQKPYQPVKTYTSSKVIIPRPTNIPDRDNLKINEQLQDIKPQKPYQPVKTYTSSKVIIPRPTNIPARDNLNFNLGTSGNKVTYKVDIQQPNVLQEPVGFEQVATVVEEEKIPFSDGSPIFATSEQMIQSFLRQTPVGPEQPAVIPDLDLPARLPVVNPSSSYGVPTINAAAPPRPDFNRSLRLRVDLAVPNSDYSEAYDIQWHAESNTAKTVIEDGSTIIYRAPLADGRIQFLQIYRDLTDGQVTRRCTLSPLMQASASDKAFPGLPAFDQFEFIGYTTAEGRSLVERWRRVVTGGPGESGAADGEVLTFTHEMFVVRDRGQAVPIRYSVVTDSSVLGPASDSYTHRYNLLLPPTSPVLPDTNNECDSFEEFRDQALERSDDRHGHQKRDISIVSKVLSKFDPIREFAGPTRDLRFDSIYTEFKKQFKRNYLDPAEEAIRKNLLIKSSRFIEAGNRLSSGFKLGANFMADRLDEEIHQLFGVQELPDGASEPGLVPFPYSDSEVNKLKLDDEFDWRPLGAVSPVRFQETTCSSCWALAGSTEGALFKKTNKLVPLSPQCLVDCGKPFGTNGCNGTWPSFAYDYVQARGLPAWDEYTNYQAKVLECKDKSVPPVTHISGHVNVTANSEAALKVAIKNHAPSVVIVDAKAQSFIYYKSGVLKDKRCGKNKPRLNHAVLAVGWGKKDGPHFIIKNTWTDKWGEGGFIRISPESCAVLERPSYSLIEKPNIDRAELRAAADTVKA